MIRIWKGPEMEGTKVGIQTLFVCATEQVNTKFIIATVEQNRDVRRIYFGAGRKAFYGVNDWKQLYDYAFTRSIELVIEVAPERLLEFIERYDSLITTFIVVHYNMPYTYNNLQFKIDDTRTVTMFNASAQTSLNTLKANNLFTCDVMLYEEEA